MNREAARHNISDVRYGFTTPIPDSAIHIYFAITLLALFAYATSSGQRAQETFGPIVEFAGNQRYTLPLALVAALIPGLVAWGASPFGSTHPGWRWKT